MFYKKKPIVVKAWQFTKENFQGNPPPYFDSPNVILSKDSSTGNISGVIKTLEGDMIVSEDDWIICGIKGEFYPCKPDIFEKTYEKASGDEVLTYYDLK